MTSGAALKSGLPDWLAVIAQTPAPVMVTTEPVIEQLPAARKASGRFDDADATTAGAGSP